MTHDSDTPRWYCPECGTAWWAYNICNAGHPRLRLVSREVACLPVDDHLSALYRLGGYDAIRAFVLRCRR